MACITFEVLFMTFLQLIHREAINHSILNHPNILPFIGIFHETDESHPIAVFPFVEKGSLEDLIRELGPAVGSDFSRIVSRCFHPALSLSLNIVLDRSLE